MRLERGRYLGRRVSARRFGSITLTETSYGPGERIGAHRHAGDYFCCVLEGRFEERAAGGTRECRRSTVVYHPAEESHADRFGESGGRCLNIEIDRDDVSDEALGGSLPRGPILLEPPIGASITPRLYREFRDDDPLAPAAIEALTLLLVAETGRAVARVGRRPRWLDEAVALIRSRSNESLTVQEIAAGVGVHPTHFSRAFARHEGMTPLDMIRRVRVERARGLLVDSSRSVASIAVDVGFCDHSHLTRTFRRYIGATPSEYRRQRR